MLNNYRDQLVGKLRHVAVKAGVQGVHYLAEGAAVATKAIEQLQDKLAQYEEQDEQEERSAQRASDVDDEAKAQDDSELNDLRAETRATAELIMDEARAVEQRIKQAKPARHPLEVTVDASAEGKSRTQGRKTTTATAPKRATAPTGGFKAKRGQKHTHDH